MTQHSQQSNNNINNLAMEKAWAYRENKPPLTNNRTAQHPSHSQSPPDSPPLGGKDAEMSSSRGTSSPTTPFDETLLSRMQRLLADKQDEIDRLQRALKKQAKRMECQNEQLALYKQEWKVEKHYLQQKIALLEQQHRRAVLVADIQPQPVEPDCSETVGSSGSRLSSSAGSRLSSSAGSRLSSSSESPLRVPSPARRRRRGAMTKTATPNDTNERIRSRRQRTRVTPGTTFISLEEPNERVVTWQDEDSSSGRVVRQDNKIKDEDSSSGRVVRQDNKITWQEEDSSSGREVVRQDNTGKNDETNDEQQQNNDDFGFVENQLLTDPYGDKGWYTGEISKSMPHGKGRMVYQKDKNITYEGDWSFGQWNGQGKATFSNGDSYEGGYRFDQRHGIGTYRWKDGRVYSGEYHDDKRHGAGLFSYPDGTMYEGEFAYGQRDGQGVLSFGTGGQYNGEWRQGHREGRGTCTWEDGRSYHGEWKKGSPNGKGVEMYPDGRACHHGVWTDGGPLRGVQ